MPTTDIQRLWPALLLVLTVAAGTAGLAWWIRGVVDKQAWVTKVHEVYDLAYNKGANFGMRTTLQVKGVVNGATHPGWPPSNKAPKGRHSRTTGEMPRLRDEDAA